MYAVLLIANTGAHAQIGGERDDQQPGRRMSQGCIGVATRKFRNKKIWTVNNTLHLPLQLIRFKGHETRALPDPSVYANVFNKGGVPNVTDTGSVQGTHARGYS
jgi:hypothetical protein